MEFRKIFDGFIQFFWKILQDRNFDFILVSNESRERERGVNLFFDLVFIVVFDGNVCFLDKEETF